jgi:hypothetical protein
MCAGEGCMRKIRVCVKKWNICEGVTFVSRSGL